MGQEKHWTLGQLCDFVGGELRGPSDLVLTRPVPAGSNDRSGITFAENAKYLDAVLASDVGAVIVGRDAEPFEKPAILVDAPRVAFFRILHLADKPLHLAVGIHAAALVDATAQVSHLAHVGAYCMVDELSVVEAGAYVFPLAYIGPRCHVAPRARIMPGAVLVQDVHVGAGAIVHSGAVLGADGFGFVWDGTKQVKIPQVGTVVVGPDAEVGANTTVDRATCGETEIGEDVKIDNLVQVGHNSKVGAHTVLAGQVGLSGSVTVGERVVAGGQVAVADHVTIGDDVSLAGRTGLMSDLLEPGNYFGVPPIPVKQAMRQMALIRRLPELMDRIKALETELEQLKK